MSEPHESPLVRHDITDVLPSAVLTDFNARQVPTTGPPTNPDVSLLEFCSVVLTIVLADVTIYNGHGYAGQALLLAVTPLLIALGGRQRRVGWQTVIVTLLTWGVAARLLWCGSELAFAIGLVLLGCVSISLNSGKIYLLEVIRFLGLLVPAGGAGMVAYDRWVKSVLRYWVGVPTFTRLLTLLMPPIAGLIFLTIFVLANPDIVKLVSDQLAELTRTFQTWVSDFIGSPSRILFWLGTAWLAVGLLRPLLPTDARFDSISGQHSTMAGAEAELYFAFRNTIQLLIVLFAAYLGFEFWTMWFRTFPPKFHFSGYAHEGAAWLTVALALATIMLSAIFRGPMMHDPRMPFLRRLAMIWAFENLALALAVYNRLSIYIGFNGMTRMRVVGLLGISAVVAGFVLVVIKMWRGHNFAWVIRMQLMAVAFAFYLYAVAPVDYWVMSYNVRQIMAGNLAPSVQISHHPTSTEGMLMLFPLLGCPDPIIREGVAELLVDAHAELNRRRVPHWSAFQMADARLLRSAKEGPVESRVASLKIEKGAAERFKTYSYRWY
ncbi:DUF4153 domain-containing protein [Schlesneria paludicola]|uniref:DUF4153 domain-containing protein n=1 Tax=Schlesneria paludicola TaxID=360056 RepID=UPI00029B4EE8|nr:DUF4153 domain-containing protein [Schlesneria paludicola]